MSFTSIVKNEASKLESIETETLAELSSIVHNSDITTDRIKILTENASVARKIFKSFKDIYGIYSKIIVRRGYNYSKNYIYIIEVSKKVEYILTDLGIYNDNLLEVPKEYIIADSELTRAYLRGLFLVSGSINDPKTSRYHLEFLVSNEEYAKFIVTQLNKFYLNSKYIKRENKFMVYVKEAEKIGDFLRIISTSNAVMYYEDIRIYRDHKNMTNRLNNCEQANVDKIIQAADKQVNDIEKIIGIGGLEFLEEKEQIVAKYRLKYRDASLQELSEIISIETGKEITKSGINHRIKKIQLLADKIKEEKK